VPITLLNGANTTVEFVWAVLQFLVNPTYTLARRFIPGTAMALWPASIIRFQVLIGCLGPVNHKLFIQSGLTGNLCF